MKWTALLVGCAGISATLLSAAEKRLPGGRASNDAAEISAAAYLERNGIRQLLGRELEDTIVVVGVTLSPRAGSSLKVFRDDFELRSYKNGQRSTPFAPTQIAGSSALVITARGGAGMATADSGPVWGPPMGGRPRRLGGEGTSIGNTASTTQAGVQAGGKGGDRPLLEILEQRVLAEGEITGPLTGLLYFYLEGKHKPKDVELFYRGPAGRLSLKFKE